MYFFIGIQDIHYNESLLLEQLEVCADTLEKAERFELLGHLYRLIVPMYEEKRNYEALANSYSHLAQAYNKIVEVTRTGKRLLGRFYRVAFFGMVRNIYLCIIHKFDIYVYMRRCELTYPKNMRCSYILYCLGIFRGGKWSRIYL